MNTNPVIRLKRSFNEGSKPSLSQVGPGELAINHFDGALFLRQDTQGVGIATRVVNVGAGVSLGNTFFVTPKGNDEENTGATEQDAFLTIKKAASVAFPGDTIKIAAGYYVEDNPITFRKNISVEGFELRNCLVAPDNPSEDLFYVSDGCHVTDISFVGKGAVLAGSFVGEPATNGAAVIAFPPLKGVSVDRYFDGARLIRANADFIAGEAVGFLTSGFSGLAGSHRAQDAARLIDLNLDFIASEAVGFITSADYPGAPFSIGISSVNDCKDDVKDVLKAVTHDLRANGNSKSVGAAQSYFVGGALAHITGTGVSEATIAALDRAAGIATYVINNYPWGSISSTSSSVSNFEYNKFTGISTVTVSSGIGVTVGDVVQLSGIEFTCPGGSGITTTIFPDNTRGDTFTVTEFVGVTTFKINVGISTIDHTYSSGGTATYLQQYQSTDTQTIDSSVIRVDYGCVGVANTIDQLVGIVTQAIGAGNTDSLPGITTGIRLDMNKCRRDVTKVLKSVCYDITRGGNTKSIGAAKSYYDTDGSKLGYLTDPDEYDQSVIALEYSKDITRAVVNNVKWGSYVTGTEFNVTNADYTSDVGIVTITTSVGHGLTSGDSVKVAGIAFTCATHNNELSIVNFEYDKSSGFSTITLAEVHGLSDGDFVELFDINFTCSGGSGITTTIFPDGSQGYIYPVYAGTAGTTIYTNVGISTIVHNYDSGGVARIGVTTTVFPDGTFGNYFEVKDYVSDTEFSIIAGISTIEHTYLSGGTVQKTQTFRQDFGQIRDLSIQIDSAVGFNNQLNCCKNVNSAIFTAVGVATAIIQDGFRALQQPQYLEPTGASYDPVSGISTLTIVGHGLTTADKIKISPYSLIFTCQSDGGITSIGYPRAGYPSFDKFIGIAATTADTITVDVGPAGISSAHTFIGVSTSDTINYGGSGITTTYEGNNGAGSVVPNDPTFSPGTDGPVFKGPYIRNCTNFIQDSIGMRINGFDAEPGDKNDLGVQGSMSVDSFTQYNQGGIGVSITNGAYAQLVSIFTICCNEAIVTLTGGQCDLTNSNSSFGEFGLVSKGVADQNSNAIYRQTAEVVKKGDPGRTLAQGDYSIGSNKVVLSGVGTQRPYDGQTLFFDKLYFAVSKVKVTNGGSGYTGPAPTITFDSPSGPDGITAQGIPIVEDGIVTSILIANSGTQYEVAPTITIGPPQAGGTQATAEVETLQPLYFRVSSATLPHNGISTVTMNSGLNTKLEGGETAYISRQSLQITSSHSFEYVGAGNTILTARPSVGGIVVQENEVVQEDGGLVIYTSTDQAGNFRIGDGIAIDQATGTISGRVYIKSLFNSVTPFILALGG